MKEQVNKFHDKSLIIEQPATHFAHGPGYWVSNKIIPLIIPSIMKELYGPEDVILASILNKAGFFPKQIPINWHEVRNVKCERSSCSYRIHSNPNNNSGLYCCMMCQLNRNHGPACQKVIFIK